ncbi:VOC family protein [Pseudorhodoferax sp.]|uniref:VOC family protein n=1 Tax=Pseudorhodoferax sp. TaxID=1993553 RepID=UPI002DD6969A|nr:VOC family protein [Pseudorhodoferax sp.]
MNPSVSAIHHFTIGCAPADLPVLLAFYTRILGLQNGYRPALRYPGHWLYAGGHAIVHLNALLQTSPARGSGPLDHVALKAHGLAATRAALRSAKVPFSETPLKGTSLHQVFLNDPLGLKVELNFDLASEEQGVQAVP